MSLESLFLQAGPGLEPALGGELRELGFEAKQVEGGVEVPRAPPGSVEQLNLWSRVANRVLLRVAEARAPAALTGLRLDAWGTSFRLEASGHGAQPFRDTVARALTPSAGGATQVLLRVERGVCTVSVDTTGELLHFRGYRQEIGRAPLRETLAAGLLRLAGWTPPEPLWDVMCGSGTIPIEAAGWALGLAPGRLRTFAFQAFPGHDARAFAALPRAREGTTPRLLGSDLNAGALGTARRNARRAGVFEHLPLERLDATALAPRAGPPGLLVANLPYGRRVGARSELGALYQHLGASLRRACPGWRFAFLLEEGAEHLGLPIERHHPLGNGGLHCTLVTGRVPGRGTSPPP